MNNSKLMDVDLTKGILSILLKGLSDEKRDDKFFMLSVVTHSVDSLKYASNRLKDDKDIVLTANKYFPTALQYASERLRDDKEVVLEVIKNNRFALKYASDRLKDDKDIVLEAVKNLGFSLQYASERLKNDKELLECLEKFDVSNWFGKHKDWYEERMGFLANLREKELMENSISHNNKLSKKIKF